MHTIYLAERWTGLCNQLFALAAGIIRSPTNKIAIGPFAPALGSGKKVPINEIIDLAETGKRLNLQLFAELGNGRSNFAWYTIDKLKFNKILSSIVFNKNLQIMADNLFQAKIHDFPEKPLINVVHFRIEPDGLAHWSRQNKISVEQYKSLLYDQYRRAIYENIPEQSIIIPLTYSLDDPLIQEISKKYQLWSFKKVLEGREMCAVIDLLLGEKCNGAFVGCHNFQRNRGSTFSYTLWQRMKCQKGVFIDLDSVKEKLQIKFC